MEKDRAELADGKAVIANPANHQGEVQRPGSAVQGDHLGVMQHAVRRGAAEVDLDAAGSA